MAEIINFLEEKKKQTNKEKVFPCHSTANEEEDIRKHLEDFYTIFPDIKRYINKSIFKDIPAKTNYTKNPLVKVKDIAKNFGLTVIEFSFADIYDTFKKGNIDINDISSIFLIPKHAILAYKEAIIFINKNDIMEERLFSIAHEIFHFIFLKEQSRNMSTIADKKRIWTEQIKNNSNYRDLKQDTNQSESANLADRFVARCDNKARREIKAILRKIPLEQKEIITLITNALKKNISDIVEDEIADYFAANLLVPVERFILWDDKPDEEIADAFRTVKECIQKRRIEIKEELEIMKPKNLSSGINLEKFAPLLHGNLIHSPGGNGIHDTEKF